MTLTFILAILCNNKPTYRVKIEKKMFKEIKNQYPIRNFRRAAHDNNMENKLEEIASRVICNVQVYKLFDEKFRTVRVAHKDGDFRCRIY